MGNQSTLEAESAPAIRCDPMSARPARFLEREGKGAEDEGEEAVHSEAEEEEEDKDEDETERKEEMEDGAEERVQQEFDEAAHGWMRSADGRLGPMQTQLLARYWRDCKGGCEPTLVEKQTMADLLCVPRARVSEWFADARYRRRRRGYRDDVDAARPRVGGAASARRVETSSTAGVIAFCRLVEARKAGTRLRQAAPRRVRGMQGAESPAAPGAECERKAASASASSPPLRPESERALAETYRLHPQLQTAEFRTSPRGRQLAREALQAAHPADALQPRDAVAWFRRREAQLRDMAFPHEDALSREFEALRAKFARVLCEQLLPGLVLNPAQFLWPGEAAYESLSACFLPASWLRAVERQGGPEERARWFTQTFFQREWTREDLLRVWRELHQGQNQNQEQGGAQMYAFLHGADAAERLSAEQCARLRRSPHCQEDVLRAFERHLLLGAAASRRAPPAWAFRSAFEDRAGRWRELRALYLVQAVEDAFLDAPRAQLLVDGVRELLTYFYEKTQPGEEPQRHDVRDLVARRALRYAASFAQDGAAARELARETLLMYAQERAPALGRFVKLQLMQDSYARRIERFGRDFTGYCQALQTQWMAPQEAQEVQEARSE